MAVVVAQRTSMFDATVDAHYTIGLVNEGPTLDDCLKKCMWQLGLLSTRLQRGLDPYNLPHIQSLRTLMCGELWDPEPDLDDDGNRPVGKPDGTWIAIIDWIEDERAEEGNAHPLANV